jgi:ribose-phosphate pyrophosphokinase
VSDTPLLIPLPGNEAMAGLLAAALAGEVGRLDLHRFPDGESYVRLLTDVAGRDVILVCTLDHPDRKLLPLLFAAATARELKATRVGLVAPYLAYMRQDRRFKPGEAVTSRRFAELLSEAFDWLVTVDPHLHRYHDLAEVYRIPAVAVHAAPVLSEWIRREVAAPLLIGPDSESEQWVAAVAQAAGAPYAVLEKTRRGDRDVQISVRADLTLDGRTPVLVDDIISSGRTMIETARLLTARSSETPICVGIHGIFADDSDRLLAAAGARVVTSNSIPHPSNAIDVHRLIADAVTSATRFR